MGARTSCAAAFVARCAGGGVVGGGGGVSRRWQAPSALCPLSFAVAATSPGARRFSGAIAPADSFAPRRHCYYGGASERRRRSATAAAAAAASAAAAARIASWRPESRAQQHQRAGPLRLLARALRLHAGAAVIPHRDKAERGGEDAYFVTRDTLGVFDGVGGWATLGIDPGLYSRRLAELARAGLEARGNLNVASVLEEAVHGNAAVGSCTACVVALHRARAGEQPGVADGGSGGAAPVEGSARAGGRAVLRCLNLGDSGAMLIRRGAVVYRTSEQQHYFNCPYQLGTESSDTVRDACMESVPVRDGDWVVLGTDGLFDNVYDEEIVACVQEWAAAATTTTKTTMVDDDDDDAAGGDDDDDDDGGAAAARDGCTELAQRVAKLAVRHALDENRLSPFARNARAAGYDFFGGKMDDVTVIVGRIAA